MASAPFPTNIQEFDADDRISFSKLDGKFIAVRDDGTEYEFDADLKTWQPLDEDALDTEVPQKAENSARASSESSNLGKRKHGAGDSSNGATVSIP